MFISKIKASSDDRSPYGDFWFQSVGMNGASGVRVSPDSAMRLSAVSAAVKLISGQFAVLPMILYKRNADGSKKRITDHWLYRLLGKRPNRWQNAIQWRRMMQAHLELRGNCYNQMVFNGRGDIVELIPIHPDRIKPNFLDNGNWNWIVIQKDGSQRTLSRDEVWHRYDFSLDGVLGLSTVAQAADSLGIALAAQSYGARFFANDAKPTGGYIKYQGGFKDKDAKIAFRESWQEMQSGSNRGKVAVLENGMEYHELGTSNEDAQFLESRQFEVTEIARWFGVPPHKIGDLSRSTNNNIEQQALELITDCLTVRTECWEYAIEEDLLLDDEGLEIEFDFRNLLRGDSAARREYNKTAISFGWLTRNEVRIDEGREPLKGLDEPLRPLNMVEEGDAEKAEDNQDAAKPAQPEQQEQPEPDEQKAQRFQSLLQSNASRLARKFAKSGKADAELIAEALAVDATAAAQWCASFVAGQTEEQITASLVALGENQ